MNEYGLPDFQMDPLEGQSEQDISNAMYGPESTTNPTDPGVALRAPDPVMLPTPGFVQEVGTVTPSPDGVFGLPGNWLDNLASSLANVQMARPRSFGQGLLGGFAQGFSTSRMRGMSEREKLDAAQRDFAAKRNQANLDATKAWQETRRKWMEDKAKRRLDREDKAWELNYRSTLESPKETFTLTPEEARAMPGYTAGAVVPKDVKQEALLRTRPGKSEGGAGGAPAPKLDDYTGLMSRMNSDQEVTRYNIIRDMWGNMQAAPNTAAGDIALVYAFMRMQDPTSTVREGEFATAQNAGGVPERIRAQYNKLVSGKLLDWKTRQDFMRTAQSMYRTRKSGIEPVLQKYENLAREFGLKPELAVTRGPERDAPIMDDNAPRAAESNASLRPDEILVQANGKYWVMPKAAEKKAISEGGKVVKRG
jgi:hypothetical protein